MSAVAALLSVDHPKRTVGGISYEADGKRLGRRGSYLMHMRALATANSV